MPFDGNEPDFWPDPSRNYQPPSMLSQIAYALRELLLYLLPIVIAFVLPALIACLVTGDWGAGPSGLHRGPVAGQIIGGVGFIFVLGCFIWWRTSMADRQMLSGRIGRANR